VIQKGLREEGKWIFDDFNSGKKKKAGGSKRRAGDVSSKPPAFRRAHTAMQTREIIRDDG